MGFYSSGKQHIDAAGTNLCFVTVFFNLAGELSACSLFTFVLFVYFPRSYLKRFVFSSLLVIFLSPFLYSLEPVEIVLEQYGI